MKRTKQKEQPACILTADWHLREDTPVCRTDNYWTTQWKKVEFVQNLQQKYQCPVYHAGDLFNHWKPSPNLISMCLEYLPDQLITIYGNHDLPQNNLELNWKSGIWTLGKAEAITILKEAHWNQDPQEGSISLPRLPRDISIWHVMTWTGEQPWPGCKDPNAKQILDQHPQFDLILTGHNHKTFVVEQDGQLLVNPGSLMRMSADQENHEPCIFLWYAKSNTVEKIILPYEKDVISRQHIEKEQQKDERIQAFVQKLNTDWTSEVSFESNLEQFFNTNQVSKTVEDIIWKSIDKEE